MLKFLGAIILQIALIWALSHSWQIGDRKSPVFGSFFSPIEGFWANAENTKAPSNQTKRLSLPSGKEVNVIFDDRLVPHIFADNEKDAYFVQGYVTAMHRLWQMDLSTRATEGRLSEIIGPSGLNYDKSRRQLGLAYAAEKAHEAWKKDTESYQLVQAYSDGVNAYIQSLKKKDLPLEYKIMQFKPEPWSPYRSVVFTKSMAHSLASSERDLEFTATLDYFGEDVIQDLFQTIDSLQKPIIPAGTQWDFEPIKINGSDSYKENASLGFENRIKVKEHNDIDDIQLGSNNWVVSGSKTKSGVPILANDPHLGLTLPSIWYECHLVLPNQNVYGASLPGLPGVIIGFNEHIAWGSTNVGHDVMDWYKIKWVNAQKQAYFLDGEKKPVENRIETYQVKGEKPVIDTIAYTIWGPVSKSGAYQDLAMKWAVLDAPKIKEGATFLALNKAQNLKEYKEAMDQYATPAQNIIFASIEGDIALKVSGSLPLRKEGQGRFVQAGDDSKNNWGGYIPSSHNPISENPNQGYLASANQISTDSTYPYYYHGEPYFEDFRSRVVNDSLKKMNSITVEDMMALQNNNYSIKAAEVLPPLLKWVQKAQVDMGPNKSTEVMNELLQWDYKYETKFQAPIYFNLWYTEFYKQVWDEFYSVMDSIPVMAPQSWRTIELTNKRPNHPFFDIQATQDKVEQASDIAILSFNNMIQQLNEINQEKKTNWGIYKNTTIRHLGNIPGFSRKAPESPGWADALNATSGGQGPSWRMVVEMQDPIQAWVVYPGGQSGNPGSPYYDTMIEHWTDGKYYKAKFVQTQVELENHNLFSIKIVGQ